MPDAAAFQDGHAPPPAPQDSIASPAFADVVVPRHLNRSFTYAIPLAMQDKMAIGIRVRVPFGATHLDGVITSLSTRLPHHAARNRNQELRLREISQVLDDAPDLGLPADLFALCRQVADWYLAPLGQCLRLVLPPSPPRRGSIRYIVTKTGQKTQDSPARLSHLPSACHSVLTALTASPKGLTRTALKGRIAGSISQALSLLARKHLIQKVEGQRRSSQAKAHSDGGPPDAHTAVASARVSTPPCDRPLTLDLAITESGPRSFLVHAPLAQRIDLLLQSAQTTLARHRTVLIVASGIARAEAIATLAKARWKDEAEVFHSGLTVQARADTWARIRTGSLRLIVGTRSAVFLPLKSLGLICVEEEEDPSLKEETEPRYHARDVARMRARLDGAMLLLTSGHPSLETVHAMGPDTIHRPPTPRSIQTVDLRQTPYGTVLSDPMVLGITEALEKRAGVILFLNRKGFASALLCRECGKSPHCPHCSVTVTFYRQAGRLSCHYCGTILPLPDACPSCLAPRLEPVGTGTERIEDTVRRLYPKATIARLDRGMSMAHTRIIRDRVLAGDIDLLIGTQMIFQGVPVPPVGFVGIVHADAGLHLPDFRASERTYHALQNAVALARPHDEGGRVVLQTYLPGHHVIVSVGTQDPARFYEQELAFRQTLDYPPFSHLISLCVSGKHEDLVRTTSQEWARYLRGGSDSGSEPEPQAEGDRMVHVLGPVPSPLAQMRGRYRWQLLVKSPRGERAREVVRKSLEIIESKKRGGLKYEVDVDPLSML